MDISDLEQKKIKKHKKVLANLMEVVKILEKDIGGKIIRFSFDAETQEIRVFGCQKEQKND